MDAKLQRWVQRRGWDRASSCYEQYWQRQLQPAIDLLLDTADLRSGEDVIDVACGTGLVSLPAARAVAPTGRVLATDIAPMMTADVEARAAAQGVTNLDTDCRDAEHLGDGSLFDVALCSLGLMYVPSPLAAVGELHRVLRPGGRSVVSVWGERRNCGWAELFPIVDARVRSDVCPMFFGLGAPTALSTTLQRAGFVDIDETRLTVELHYANDDEALGAAFLGGPVALASSRFDDETRRSAHTEYLASIAPFADGAGYRVPGEFVIASARRAEHIPHDTALSRHRSLTTPLSHDNQQHDNQHERNSTMTITNTPVDNGVNTEALLGARDALTNAPEAAEFTWRASCSWVHGTYSRTTVDGFSGLGQDHRHRSTFVFDADHPECFASEDRGATPVEHVLAALASCLTAGVAAVAQHRQIQLKSVVATLEGNMNILGILGADPDTRNGFSDIKVRFAIDADASPDEIRALVAQSQKRSAVYDVVTNPTNVTVEVV